MDEHSIYKELLSWFFGVVFSLSVFFGGFAMRRAGSRADEQEREHKELERRVRSLEKDSVTHDDLRRLESKIDEHNKQVTERLDRIIARGDA